MANNFYTYQKTVTTSGTPVQLPAQAVEPGQVLILKAKLSNGGTISIGNSSANALNSGSNSYKLQAGHEVSLQVTDASQVWIDSSNSGDSVEIIVGALSSSRYVVSLGTAQAGEDLANDVLKTEERFDYLAPITASTLIKTGVGRLKGFFVSAASATPTITVYDNTSAAGTKILDTFTPAAGQMYLLPTTNFSVGLYIAISGTVTLTPFYK